MRYLFLSLFCSLFALNLHSQETYKDTITLQEVKISKKKLKVVTVKQGKGKQEIGNGFFKTVPTQTFFIENLPYGTIQEIRLHFMWMVVKSLPDSKPINTNILKTTYELTIYDVKENQLGNKINKTPIQVTIPEGRKSEPSVTVDLSKLSFTTDKLLVELKRVSPLPCSECKMYIPYGYDASTPNNTKDIGQQNRRGSSKPPSNVNLNFGLLCEIKTLTREY